MTGKQDRKPDGFSARLLIASYIPLNYKSFFEAKNKVNKGQNAVKHHG